jgi:hypothetical protein
MKTSKNIKTLKNQYPTHFPITNIIVLDIVFILFRIFILDNREILLKMIKIQGFLIHSLQSYKNISKTILYF